MLKLVTSQAPPELLQRVTRMLFDVRFLQTGRPAEIRSVYNELELIRDRLSEMLDRVDNKHV